MTVVAVCCRLGRRRCCCALTSKECGADKAEGGEDKGGPGGGAQPQVASGRAERVLRLGALLLESLPLVRLASACSCVFGYMTLSRLLCGVQFTGGATGWQQPGHALSLPNELQLCQQLWRCQHILPWASVCRFNLHAHSTSVKDRCCCIGSHATKCMYSRPAAAHRHQVSTKLLESSIWRETGPLQQRIFSGQSGKRACQYATP